MTNLTLAVVLRLNIVFERPSWVVTFTRHCVLLLTIGWLHRAWEAHRRHRLIRHLEESMYCNIDQNPGNSQILFLS